uniref:Uncharacterized protein n=1 Tax=Ignisphaera aggregans TaxID=334771 RepID=A0A7C5XKA7_9CREN
MKFIVIYRFVVFYYEDSTLNLFNIVSRVVDISSGASMIAIEFNSFNDLINNIFGILCIELKIY